MNFIQILDYYKKTEITEQLLRNAKNREVAGALRSGGFGSRPNILQFPSDVVQMAQAGVISFHYSVEHWPQPMSVGMKNYQSHRMGWDFVLDIDSKLSIEESRIAAVLVCDLLEKYGIKNYGIKFSGSRGFHIILPWIMFPEEVDYEPFSKRYPEASQILAGFMREKIKDSLMAELIKKGSVPAGEDPFLHVELEKNWSNRHMFRAPYSLNEKTWLVSVPLTKQHLIKFSTDYAKPENVNTKTEFFKGNENEAELLLSDAMDWHAMQNKEEEKPIQRIYTNTKKIPESVFPPCIRNVLNGMSDGRKRGLFILINFLKTSNWSPDEIEERIRKWNSKNENPLPESLVISQLRYHENRETVPPANCESEMYYKDTGICAPDPTCRTIKNPAGYALKKSSALWEKPVYKCSVCNMGFENMKSLNRHISRAHGTGF